MVYTILISIVFIAELIIAITIIQSLIKLDKKVLNLNLTLVKLNPKIKDISSLITKISEQWVIITQDFVDKTKKESEDILLKQLSKFLVGLLVLSLNFKFVKKIRKSKLTKTLVKGWSFLENMV